MGYGAPFETSGLMTMQSPANSLLSEWLKGSVKETEPDTFWNAI